MDAAAKRRQRLSQRLWRLPTHGQALAHTANSSSRSEGCAGVLEDDSDFGSFDFVRVRPVSEFDIFCTIAESVHQHLDQCDVYARLTSSAQYSCSTRVAGERVFGGNGSYLSSSLRPRLHPPPAAASLKSTVCRPGQPSLGTHCAVTTPTRCHPPAPSR